MKIILTGATGMVGEGVLMECLSHPDVTNVLSVSRKPSGKSHPKLSEYIVADFMSLKENDQKLQGSDACFFCAGISSVGIKEPEYSRITYDTTMAFTNAVGPKSQMTFTFISGAGTDSSENGNLMWARVKGRTENDLAKLPFKNTFAFRPGLMRFTAGQKNVSRMNRLMSRLYLVFNTLFPKVANTVSQLGQATVNVAQHGYEKRVLEVSDIKMLAALAATEFT